eukprot:TRINITY_DN59811_c0_g1_i2.p1 TRINITY_DN59811_c0_g1~~TRINITY_DN59811_c0_g1_i2.p1  ORF type:complete len:426 (+),score=66.18 TRINITY_DN59811_c0_g1_i2:106-1383(+)
MRALRRLDTAGIPDDFSLAKQKYGFAASWDAVNGRPAIDLDLQCVVVDERGAIVDCAYYNNLKAVQGAVKHSGDESTGAKSGLDEVVWVNTEKLPPNVSLLIFVLAAYSGGCLEDVANGRLHVLEETRENAIACFQMENSQGTADVVAVMFRTSAGGWSLRIIDEPAQEGQHFMDILPLIAETVRCFIPTAPKRQKVAFAMDKGSVMDLPQMLSKVTIGLGWDLGAEEIDMDVSAILLDSSAGEVETIFFGREESLEHGVKHMGDNVDGEGEGDDEQIEVVLSKVGPVVQQIVFVVNVYTPKKTFLEVASPYCRVLDDSGNQSVELCRYKLDEAGKETGLMVAKLLRERSGGWSFHALGTFCPGRNYKDSLPHVRKSCLQSAGASTAAVEADANRSRWTCSGCGEPNRPERDECNNCGRRQPILL